MPVIAFIGVRNLVAHVGQEFGLNPGRLQRGVARLLQGKFRLLKLCHVSRNADDARDGARLAVNWNFGHRRPDFRPLPTELALQLIDERLARRDDPLFVLKELPGQLLG